jgi:hypothetical protein
MQNHAITGCKQQAHSVTHLAMVGHLRSGYSGRAAGGGLEKMQGVF